MVTPQNNLVRNMLRRSARVWCYSRIRVSLSDDRAQLIVSRVRFYTLPTFFAAILLEREISRTQRVHLPGGCITPAGHSAPSVLAHFDFPNPTSVRRQSQAR